MDVDLDILGQQPLLNIYTQICFCYTLTGDDSSYPAIISTLTSGLERLSASFPWIAGKVVIEGQEDGNTGIFKIKSFEKIPRLVVKDLRNDHSVPTMDELRRAKFPMSMLDESIIAPRRTLPGSPEESTLDSKPVFLLQATFITGGLLLTFVGQHNTMDMTGQGHMIYLLSKACRKEQFTAEELSSGNRDRRNVVPLLDDAYKQGSELVREVLKPKTTTSQTNSNGNLSPPPKSCWASFIFDHIALSGLKSLATETLTLPSSYISTDDALSAFIWQSIIRARLHRLNSTSESTFARAVDVRRYLAIPKTYPGLLQNMVRHTYTVQKLVEEPLGGVASEFRSAVDPQKSDLKHRTRELATFLNRTPDKNAISFTASLDLSTDIMLSSWAEEESYEVDFNLGLGKPEAVRRPRFVPVESLIYLMPKSPEGEIAVAICLREEDMERLRADKAFTKYGSYVG